MSLFGGSPSNRNLLNDAAWVKAQQDAFAAGDVGNAAAFYTPVNQGELTGNQKLALLGATLRDVGSSLRGEDGDALLKTQALQQAEFARTAMAQRQAALYKGLFGGSAAAQAAIAPADVTYDANGMPTATAAPAAAAPRPKTLQQVMQLLGPAVMTGVPGAKDMLTMFKETQPDIDVANGEAYDKHNTAPGTRVGVNVTNVNGTLIDPNDRKNIDRYVGTAPVNGSVPTYDPNTGKQNGWRLAGGTAEAMQTAAAADAAGKGMGTAAYSLDTVTGPDGRPITGSRLSLLRQGPIVGQSDAEKAGATDAAKLAAERAGIQPQQRAAIDQQSRTTDLVINSLTDALGKIDNGTAGMGALVSHVPGTRSYDLAKILDTVRANVGFDALADMRKNSPTGGALGSVSEQENRLLQSVRGSLDQGQSPEQFKKTLQGIIDQLKVARDARAKVYNQIYASPAAPAAATPSRGPTMSMGRSKIIAVQ